MRWPADDSDFTEQLRRGVPDLALWLDADPGRALRLVTLPAAGAYALLSLAGGLLYPAMGRKNPQRAKSVCN